MFNICARDAKTALITFGLCMTFIVQVAFSAETSGSDAAVKVEKSWSDVALDVRCEGLLAFLKATTAAEISGWDLIKPQCVIAGGAGGDVSWSIDAAWERGEGIAASICGVRIL